MSDGTEEHAHTDETSIGSGTTVDVRTLAAGARLATHKEHNTNVKKSISIWYPAILWCLLTSSTIIMEGYDTALMGAFFALPQFQEKYGKRTTIHEGPEAYDIPSSWKQGITCGALVGQIFGSFLAGRIQPILGYKKTILGALLLMKAFVFILFFAPNIQTILIGFTLCGIPWGIFQPLATSYASEVLPVALRAYLATYINMCWIIGQLVSSGVMAGFLSRTDQWAYRIPLALQWLWPIPIFCCCCWLPESPWWLIQNERWTEQERENKARQVLVRLTNSSQPDFSIDETLDMMLHTNQGERTADTGTSYSDCFKGVDLRRTEISCTVWFIQTTCGSSAFLTYLTYFYQLAGLKTENSFGMAIATYGMGLIGTILSWSLMAKVGRRTIYLWGSVILFVFLMLVGFVSLVSPQNGKAAWTLAGLVLAYTFFYDLTLGPVCYSLVSEISSTRLRTKTVSLARIAYNIGTIIVNILAAFQFSPDSGFFWGAKSGFFWAGSCLLGIVWIFFRLPEPKGRTYGELDELFERKISARKFRTTNLETLSAVQVPEVEAPATRSTLATEVKKNDGVSSQELEAADGASSSSSST